MSIDDADTAQSTNCQHVLLSPHLDDAALSCGGMIAELTSQGYPVLVVNVCSGSPAPDAVHSSFAADLHTRWGLPAADAVRLRLAEDRLALERLGVDRHQLDLLDAIYRMPAAYVSDERLFGAVDADDPLLDQLRLALTGLRQRYPSATFYAPLAVGYHVDHQIVYRAAVEQAQLGMRVSFYEDFPYVAVAGALERRMNDLGGSARFEPMVVAVESSVQRKITALQAYTSQIGALFGGNEAMADRVTSFAASLRSAHATHGERLWVPR
jgi:LmbE family N-acetylglucosaminyl deacetylase